MPSSGFVAISGTGDSGLIGSFNGPDNLLSMLRNRSNGETKPGDSTGRGVPKIDDLAAEENGKRPSIPDVSSAGNSGRCLVPGVVDTARFTYNRISVGSGISGNRSGICLVCGNGRLVNVDRKVEDPGRFRPLRMKPRSAIVSALGR